MIRGVPQFFHVVGPRVQKGQFPTHNIILQVKLKMDEIKKISMTFGLHFVIVYFFILIIYLCFDYRAKFVTSQRVNVSIEV